MSQLLVQHYLNDLSDLRRISGEARESVVREAFKTLLKDWGRSRDLIFIPEYKIETPARELRYVDGALLHELRVPFGYWEAKDEADDLDEEIEKKFRRGYPQDNIIFEDSHKAILIQNRQEVVRCGVDDPAKLKSLLDLFFSYERKEIADFRKAVAQFKTDLPAVLGSLRDMIDRAEADNVPFRKAATKFLKHAQDTINPSVTAADVREMLIQHILTEEIFSQVFDNADFHRQNNVARELYALENTFFTGKVKHDTLAGLKPYYAAIRSAAALVSNHQEKQTFLKTIYENFYKVYDRKKADRLGVVYTPNEIVRFMIESTDWLCQKHFGKALIDRNVEILDPAAGTGTFITELIEHFRGQPAKLRYKYMEELHANEVAILPYYVANLNIEATFAAIYGEYEEFPNLCFVDTLDNTAALRAHKGQQGDLFGGVSEENVARIKRQNKKKISVIIGNPPYNANQLNENENNKNREYPEIDRRIKATYIDASTAQKTKLYDMYARFFRWASDRIDENGIIAFVSNSSFIDGRTYDGFRKLVAQDFNEIWIIDLKGNARTTGERRRKEASNIFEDQIRVGVAIYFCVKKSGEHGCQFRYDAVPDYAKFEEKRDFLRSRIQSRDFQYLKPDVDANWINQTNNDFETLLSIADKNTKSTTVTAQEMSIFKLYSLGIVTNRDEWAFDDDMDSLKKKVQFFCTQFETEKHRWEAAGRPITGDFVNRSIKWTSELEAHLRRGTTLVYDEKQIVNSLYRPFVKRHTYFAPVVTHRSYQNLYLFPDADHNNIGISFCIGKRSEFGAIGISLLPSLDMFVPNAGQVVCRWRFSDGGERIDNITDWALDQFRAHYEHAASGESAAKAKRASKKTPTPDPSPQGGGEARRISKDAIFHYVYGVLHDPLYREKYALNLKREFPRIPFYADFW